MLGVDLTQVLDRLAVSFWSRIADPVECACVHVNVCVCVCVCVCIMHEERMLAGSELTECPLHPLQQSIYIVAHQ